MSAHYPLEKQQFHHEYSLDLNSVPKDFLQVKIIFFLKFSRGVNQNHEWFFSHLDFWFIYFSDFLYILFFHFSFQLFFFFLAPFWFWFIVLANLPAKLPSKPDYKNWKLASNKSRAKFSYQSYLCSTKFCWSICFACSAWQQFCCEKRFLLFPLFSQHFSPSNTNREITKSDSWYGRTHHVEDLLVVCVGTSRLMLLEWWLLDFLAMILVWILCKASSFLLNHRGVKSQERIHGAALGAGHPFHSWKKNSLVNTNRNGGQYSGCHKF